MRRAAAVALAHVVACALFMIGLSSPASGAPAEDEVHPEWGSVTAPNAVLRRGCKRYSYTYDIKPPPGDWGLEIFIRGPNGKVVASAAWLTPDPLRATRKFGLCKAVTRPGRFTIKAKLSVQNGQEYVEGWLPPSKFRLHRPRR